MKTLLNFATPEYETVMERCRRSAAPFFDRTRLCRPCDLDADFQREHRAILGAKRGAGFWIWKPYLLLQTLAQVKPGGFVFYVDSQCVFCEDPKPLFDLCADHGGILLFHQKRWEHQNQTWTKRDAFVLTGCDEANYRAGDNLVGGTQLYQNTPAAIDFLTELLHWCSDWRIISDDPNTTGPNYPGFRDHRHDQSILSLMAIRNGISPVCDITQWGVGWAPMDRIGGKYINLDREVFLQYGSPWSGREFEFVGAPAGR